MTQERESAPERHGQPPLLSRFRIVDLLTSIFIAGLIAAAWPDVSKEVRAALFVVFVFLATASGLWAANIARTYGIEKFWKRVLIHLYAFAAFVSFLAIIPLTVFLLFALSTMLGDIVECVRLVLIMLVPAALTVSMPLVEIQRGRREAARKR